MIPLGQVVRRPTLSCCKSLASTSRSKYRTKLVLSFNLLFSMAYEEYLLALSELKSSDRAKWRTEAFERIENYLGEERALDRCGLTQCTALSVGRVAGRFGQPQWGVHEVPGVFAHPSFALWAREYAELPAWCTAICAWGSRERWGVCLSVYIESRRPEFRFWSRKSQRRCGT